MKLSGFTIGEVIHAAGDTVVAAARTSNGEAVVLKVLDAEHPTPETSARWQHEFAMLRAIESPWVIKARALHQVGRRSVLELEDFAATDLAQVISRKLLDFPERLSIALQLAEAVSDIHKHGLIHGDLAPKNVLVDLARLRIKVCDFGLASRLQTESFRDTPQSPRGTLDYMSPEQTGRTNLQVDYRSDFYSLGVTFYELFAGRRPFQIDDSLSLLHAQLTLQPEPLEQLDPNLPTALSQLVQKLLAKVPDDRYQSSFGLCHDLTRITELWKRERRVPAFELGTADVPERFCLSQRLYGREQETESVLQAFERVSDAHAELLLISGEAGIGKTALVAALHRPIVARRGYFLRGKCDQFGRNQPYAALVRAFEPLLQQLATEGETRRHYWRGQLTDALGAQAAAVAEILPNLSLLLGSLPALPMVPPAESEQRFHIAFLQFVKALAASNHPLLLFLDDLQWADVSTLKLIEHLLGDDESRSVLIVGSYRDQEIDDAHPLALMASRLSNSPGILTRIKLRHLGSEQISALLADTLRQPEQQIASLRRLVMEKTHGNPFFVGQFLSTLVQESALHYDRSIGSWRWDIDQISASNMTDNVVTLMLNKLRLLGPDSQRALAIAAELGERFALRDLMQIEDDSAGNCHARLWPALQAGFLMPLNEDYKFEHDPELLAGARFRFLHDRVQQAARDLTPEAERPAFQYHCGRRLLATCQGSERDARLFTILACLNGAIALIKDPAERTELSALNRHAGLRAKHAAALDAAVRHLRQARLLLPEDAWQTDPDNTLLLYRELAEAEYLSGHFEAAEALYPEAIRAAPTVIGKVSMLLVHADQLHIQGRFPDAMPVLREALALLGRPFPESEADAGALFPSEFAATELALVPFTHEALLSAPEMHDAERLLEMRVYFALSYATYQSGAFASFAVDACRLVQTTLTHGQSDLACIAYVTYMTAMAAMKKPYAQCHAMGRLALTIAEQRQSQYFRMPVYQYFSPFYQHWCEPLSATLPYMERGLELALTGINPLSGGFCVLLAAVNRAIMGVPLDELALDCERALKFLKKSRQPKSDAMLRVGVIQPMLALKGQTQDLLSFDTDSFQVDLVFQGDYQTPSIPLAFLQTAMLRHAYLFDAPSHWAQAATQVGMVGMCLPDSPTWVEAQFYLAMGLLRDSFAEASGKATEARLTEAEQFLALFRTWSADCAGNFRHKALLIAAELARVRGEERAAMDFYAQSIEAAGDAGFLVCEALANERYADFWAGHQQRQLARNFIKEAYHLYRRWGASAKCAELERRWPDVSLSSYRVRSASTVSGGTYRHTSEHASYLDLQSLLKANQLLARELQLDSLLRQMLSVLLENAGAERGAIVLDDNGRLIVEVVGGLSPAKRLESSRIARPLGDPSAEANVGWLPSELIEYARLTRTTLVINSPHLDERFARSHYLAARQPKSVLCLPVITQGRIVALVYLENNQLENAFTVKQQQTLELLSAQAAISLVNAHLVEHLEAKVEARTRELRMMSMKDGLTGIANRRAFDEWLDVEWRRSLRDGTPLSLLMIDIDHFKQYNDSQGHLEGDQCIGHVARTLASVAEACAGMVARYGGEEFALLVPDTNLAAAKGIAETSLAAIAAQALAHPRSSVGPWITLSIGVSSLEPAEATADDHLLTSPLALVAKADQALYRAKQDGRNCWRQG